MHGASIDRVRIQIEFKPAVNDGAPALEPATARQRQRQVRESQSAVFPVEAGLQALNRNQLAIEGACALIAHTEFAAHGRSVRRFALQHRIDIEQGVRHIRGKYGRIDTGEVHGERRQRPFGERRQQRAQGAGGLGVATNRVGASDDLPLDTELRELTTPAQVEFERLVERAAADHGCGAEIEWRIRSQRGVAGQFQRTDTCLQMIDAMLPAGAAQGGVDAPGQHRRACIRLSRQQRADNQALDAHRQRQLQAVRHGHRRTARRRDVAHAVSLDTLDRQPAAQQLARRPAHLQAPQFHVVCCIQPTHRLRAPVAKQATFGRFDLQPPVADPRQSGAQQAQARFARPQPTRRRERKRHGDGDDDWPAAARRVRFRCGIVVHAAPQNGTASEKCKRSSPSRCPHARSMARGPAGLFQRAPIP